MKIILVTGTRPQIIKSAPILKLLKEDNIDHAFIHTGQHYDIELASQFISEFKIDPPAYDLEVGSGTGAYQIREIMSKLETILSKNTPDYLIVPGDTNSALAAALTGFKMDIATCHLESGLRSFDMFMQEEINRRLIDHGSAGLFAPTETAVENLENENVIGNVYHVGDTMFDILKQRFSQLEMIESRDEIFSDFGISEEPYSVLTLHRRENVDIEERLRSIVDALNELDFRIIFPMHPRTKDRLEKLDIKLENNISIIPPIPYNTMMLLVKNSKLLMTDSGGLQKEAYILNTPCVTIRDNTEWVETINAGANILTSHLTKDIMKKASMMWGKQLNNDDSVYGDGNASRKIVDILLSEEIAIHRSNQVT